MKILFNKILAGTTAVLLFIGLASSTNIQSSKNTIRHPVIYFKENSLVTVPFNYDTDSFQTTLQKMSAILTGNPTLNLEIRGHADIKENNPQDLSKKRANYVRNALLQYGVTTNRLVLNNLGSDEMRFSDSLISAQKTKPLADSLRQMNRRVTFNTLINR